ncbi:MAG TPA: hypothetical protein VGO80_01970 [Solirubrobacteraceae bacterium]|jgi:hypothetical protein|nr:hypothetical protein [Solirubrobacteraceae bacterium]
MRRLKQLNPALIAVAIVALAVLWLVRPMWHGLAMFLWTSPFVWLPPLALLLVGAILLRRSQRSWATLEDLRTGVRPPSWLVAFPAGAFLLFVVAASFTKPLVERAIVKHTTYEAIPGLPANGKVRLVPREVAEQNAASAFNSPTETLTNFRIVNTSRGLQWTALRTPQGVFRVFTKKSKGLVELDAQNTARSLRQIDAELKIAPGLQITDNLRWQLLKRRFLISLEEPVGIETKAGPRLLVPYLEYKGLLIRRPVLGGVFVVAPDGTIEDLEPEQAARRTDLAVSGRVFPDTQARRVQDAYQYKRGLWNAWFVHEDQTRINDTEINRQPYLVDFGAGGLGLQWVTVAEPYGRAFAASAIFLTDAVTGRTRIWRVPERRSLSGNVRAIQAVKAVSIPGIDFGDAATGSGNFRVVEPRPVFVKNHLVYLTSIIPNSANAVSKTVIVDAETNKLVAIFDNDRDPEAERKTLRYIETGEIPDEAVASGAAPATGTTTTPGTTPTPGSTTTPPGTAATPGATQVERRIDDILRRQRELVDELQRLREDVRKRKGG